MMVLCDISLGPGYDIGDWNDCPPCTDDFVCALLSLPESPMLPTEAAEVGQYRNWSIHKTHLDESSAWRTEVHGVPHTHFLNP